MRPGQGRNLQSKPPGDHSAPMPGFAARRLAAELLRAVLVQRRALDDALASRLESPEAQALEPRDRALARLIAATALRRLPSLETLLNGCLERPLPAERGNLWPILLAAAAQLLLLSAPPHAVINIAVEQVRRDRAARRFDKLANAVLRRLVREGAAELAAIQTPRHDIPAWLLDRWIASYGETTALAIAAASLIEAPLDLSVKADAAAWAEKLGGVLLSTGSVRLAGGGRIEELAGFAEGAWWVQDAAAALPARLMGARAGLEIADLCAAPGGKTAELAAAGARVTAVDRDGARLGRLRANLVRLKLDAKIIEADATTWSPGRTFDAVLLDAPCTATGTIRRHPDILHLKRPEDVAKLAALQARMLENATRLVRPGGTLVYCTCSLEPEEGLEQIARALAAHNSLSRVPIEPEEIGAEAAWITADGDLRTLPHHLPRSEPHLSGLDGFYAARLRLAP